MMKRNFKQRINKPVKIILVTALLFCGLKGYAQSSDEQQILGLSTRIFKLEVAAKTDSLNNILHEKFSVMVSTGVRQTRSQYMARLSSGSFVHNAISVQESAATVAGNTGVVMGKGKFTVTAAGKQSVLMLGFTEVFTRTDSESSWQLLAIHANPLPPASN